MQESAAENWLYSRPLEERLVFFAVLASSLLVVADIEDHERLYWPYLLSSYAIAALVFLYERWRTPIAGGPTLLGYLFPKNAWLTASAGHDFAITLINYIALNGLSAYILLNADVLPQKIIHGLHGLLPQNQGPVPSVGIIALYTLATWLCADFMHYWAHRLSHQIGWLWEFHKVHHSARNLNPLTVSRAHPIDVLLISNSRAIGSIVAGLVFLYFYPNLKGIETVGGVNAFIFVTYLLGTNLHHTNIWWGWGPLEYLLLSPAQHQIHHSEDPKHYNRNYASILTIWDWVFGTLYVTKGKENLTFGLGSENKNYATLKDLYVRPVKRAARKLVRKPKKPGVAEVPSADIPS